MIYLSYGVIIRDKVGDKVDKTRQDKTRRDKVGQFHDKVPSFTTKHPLEMNQICTQKWHLLTIHLFLVSLSAVQWTTHSVLSVLAGQKVEI